MAKGSKPAFCQNVWSSTLVVASMRLGGSFPLPALNPCPDPAPAAGRFFHGHFRGRKVELRKLDPDRLAAAAGRGWRAYREDLGGFALGWVIVVVLVAATALLLRMT